MGISTILILLPGLLAFGISKILSRSKSRPINEIVIDLVVQTVAVFFIYYLVSSLAWLCLPNFGAIAVESIKIKEGIEAEDLKSAMAIFERAMCASVFIAIGVGIVTALAGELKIIQKFGRRFWLFQSDANESAWKKTFEVGSSDCWIHVDTKGGQRYVGLGQSISWDHKDGGIGLYDVHLFDEDSLEVLPVADYIYISTEDLNGPILFIKGKPNEKEKK
jgi:hypothetical protein